MTSALKGSTSLAAAFRIALMLWASSTLAGDPVTYGSLDNNWQMVAWPYLRDAWPQGLALHCANIRCGSGVDLFVRPKIGFCNCTKGISDDFEVDNVTDLDLLSDHFVPTKEGRAITLGRFKGRTRTYQIAQGGGTPRTAVAFALANQCDLIVASAAGDSAAAVETSALEFLSAPQTQRWMEASLGLR